VCTERAQRRGRRNGSLARQALTRRSPVDQRCTIPRRPVTMRALYVPCKSAAHSLYIHDCNVAQSAAAKRPSNANNFSFCYLHDRDEHSDERQRAPPSGRRGRRGRRGRCDFARKKKPCARTHTASLLRGRPGVLGRWRTGPRTAMGVTPTIEAAARRRRQRRRLLSRASGG